MAALTAILLAQDAGTDDIVAQLTAAAGGGDSFVGNDKALVVVNNGGGGSITVTIVSNGTDPWGYQGTSHDVTRTVAAGKMAFIMVNNLARFKDSNGLVQITYSGVTTVKTGVFRVP